jgi:hypothetical protein
MMHSREAQGISNKWHEDDKDLEKVFDEVNKLIEEAAKDGRYCIAWYPFKSPCVAAFLSIDGNAPLSFNVKAAVAMKLMSLGYAVGYNADNSQTRYPEAAQWLNIEWYYV